MGARRFFARLLARRGRDAGRRFGNRVVIEELGVLRVCDRTIHGYIHDVGLSGAYFSAAEQPLVGARGTLSRKDGRPIDVRVVWRQRGGVGLAFARHA
jgi:hypothetical protein